MPATVGSKVDQRYLLQREVARGERSIVYQAQHLFTRRTVALKMLYGPAAAQEDERDALLAQARLLSELRHPCIVDVIDAGQARGLAHGSAGPPYLAMEMLEGRSLAGVLAARSKLEVDDAVRLLLGLCSALTCIHDAGASHYALVPSNIFMPPAGPGLSGAWPGVYEPPAKIIDFGIAARAIMAGYEEPRGWASGRAVTDYLAPEQLRGEPTDGRCDLFALGVVIYECLTGTLPYEKSSIDLEQGATISSPSVLRKEVSPPLGAALIRAFARRPEDRYESAQAFAHAVKGALKEAPKPTPEAAPPPQPVARRATPRASYLTPVRILRANGSSVDGNSEDISEGGMLLVGPADLENHEAVQVRFALPITGDIVAVNAVARWQRAARDGRGATGLQFLDLAEGPREAIRNYIKFFGVTKDER